MAEAQALRRQPRGDVLPLSLPPIGISREQSAAFVGVGVTLFDEMVADGRMPGPKYINTRAVWDVDELRLAFKALPSNDDTDNNEWDEECESSSKTDRAR